MSKARAVMRLLIELDNEHRSEAQIAQMTIADQDALFRTVVMILFRNFVYFDKSYTDAELNAMNVGTRSYLTVYDHVDNFASNIDAEDDFLHA